MLNLKMVCGACPEAYDVFDENGTQVAYFRLRHGSFTAECPDVGGACVYQAWPEGDGIFEVDERDYYFRWAVWHTQNWIDHPEFYSDPGNIKPAPPDVEYTVTDGY